MDNNLHIYTSSAGSGKTFTLVKEYLKIVLRSPDEYRHVLAITFTNKAAEEMKLRVIEALVSMSSGASSDLMLQLTEELSSIDLQERSGIVLKKILHDYPSFSISTIDSFFSKLLRALAREIHLPLRAEIQLEEDDAVLEVTDRLLHQAGNDKELADWLQQLILKKLEEDKGWNLEKDIQWIAKELLKDRGEEHKNLSRQEIQRIIQELKELRKSFESDLQSIGDRATTHIENQGYNNKDFFQGDRGVAMFFQKIRHGRNVDDFKINKFVRNAVVSIDGWLNSAGKKNPAKIALVESFLWPLLIEANGIIQTRIRGYVTSIQLLRTLYLFGIVNDLSRQFADYRKENNQLLISDTAKLLQGIITGEDTPFIYEKTGNRYKYLLIDEFQDTSEVQWANLLPLVINSLGSGFMTLIVGDAKQSIYRWRGGDLKLLLTGVKNHLKGFEGITKNHNLTTNFRSKFEVVKFNNLLFSKVPELLKNLPNVSDLSLLDLAYGEGLIQKVAAKNDRGGYVELRLFENNDDTSSEDAADSYDEEFGKQSKWKKNALERSYEVIVDLIKRGYHYRDIAFLVRNNKDGNVISNFLFEKGIDKIITPDSMSISGSPKVRFLINAFRLLADPKDAIAKSQLLYYHIISTGKDPGGLHSIFMQPDSRKKKKDTGTAQSTLYDMDALTTNAFNQHLPPAFTQHLSSLSKLPVYEISEQLVRIFNLHQQPDAYIQRFQDLVLEYNTKQHASVGGFIRWWDTNERIRMSSVELPENEDAIRIMSVHKSKGLQFPIVLMPFVDWSIFPKHGELIWVQSEETPFDQLGRIGVYTGSKLSTTVFSEDWQSEVAYTLVDNVNTLYVAFTRAENELYIFGPSDNGGELNRSNKLILRSWQAMGHPSTEGQTMIFGQTELAPAHRKKTTSSDLLPSYPSNRWQEKISIAAKAHQFSELLNEKKDSKVKYGILVHAVIAEIRNRSDVEKAVDKVIFEGMAKDVQRDDLHKLILQVIDHPSVKPFFDSDWEIRREQEILTTETRLLRPDRVLTKGDAAIIIDFKTGNPNESHHHQLRTYSHTLTEMGYCSIQRYLVYLKDHLEVVEVRDEGVVNSLFAS